MVRPTALPLASEDRQLRALVEGWLATPRPDLPLPPDPGDPALSDAVRRVRWSVSAPEFGPNVFGTNSVWQAELELWHLMGQTRTIRNPTEIEPGRALHPRSLSAMRPLFRGEPLDSSNRGIRPLTTSAQRGHVPTTRVARLNHLFARIVDRVIAPKERYGVEVSELSWWAVARHYGMPSNLIDLTADPSVATHFADGSSTRLGVVYWLPARWCVARGLKILLPPPSCDRLYLQRGVLLDTTGLGDEELLRESCSVVFPTSGHHRVIRPAPPNGPPDVFWSAHPAREIDVMVDRGGRGALDWIPWLGRRREHWFRRVVVWVKKHTEETHGSSPAADASLARQVVRAVGEAAFLEGTSWAAYARALNRQLIWVAGLEIRSGTFALDSDIRAQLERDNTFLRNIDRLPWMARP